MEDKKYDVDKLLKGALRSTEAPDEALLQTVKYYSIEEDYIMKKQTFRFSFGTIAAIIAITVLATTTVFAAWHFMKPSDIALMHNDYSLSAAFNSETAININQSVESGNYIFSLLAVVSGRDIADMEYYSEGVLSDDRTYAVVAIQNADGTPMPSSQDSDYGKVSFMASPLIKGYQPWLVNAVTLNGAYSETVIDGVMYRIVECSNVSVFADHGLYFSICDRAFINNQPFNFDEQTGEITANPDYDGASVIFDLPIDESLADSQKAQQILENIDPNLKLK